METQFAKAEIRRMVVEQKIKDNLSKLSKDLKLLVQGMGVIGSASRGSTSNERTITDKGKGTMNEEQIQGKKSERESNPIVDKGIRVPCVPNHREIPLFDKSLLKLLEVPIFRGKEEENVGR